MKNESLINPIKREIIKNIVSAARTEPMVRKIIIFGSSIREDCRADSDVDICIDWNQDCYDSEGVLKPFTISMRRKISMLTKGHVDVVNYGYLKGTYIEDAVKNGVVVYESNE